MACVAAIVTCRKAGEAPEIERLVIQCRNPVACNLAVWRCDARRQMAKANEAIADMPIEKSTRPGYER